MGEPAATTIQLAREPEFLLGRLAVRPAILEVSAGQVRRQLEPRLMQVLVALARRPGAVVSREELIQTCWAGRIVGDDAINRCIHGLRRLAEDMGEFSIETVPRVGYRLGQHNVESGEPGPQVLLAVLAFENLTPDPNLGYFSDGLSEEILHAVARRTNLRVIGRSSSFSLRGVDKSARNVARELGASHLLDGSVRRHGNLVRVSLQLVECEGQTSVWSERFDRDLSDVLALQEDIASAVATALHARFSGPQRARPVDPVAYDLFLQTRPTFSQGAAPSRTIPLLEKAVALAPDFARAWGALAMARIEAYRRLALDTTPLAVRREEVIAAADRALQLDPACGQAHVARANLLSFADYAGREDEFSTAFRDDPGVTDVRTQLGWFLNSVGRNEEALKVAAEGRALDPLNPRIANLHAQMLSANGHHRESLRASAEGLERWPYAFVFVSVPLFLAAALGDDLEVDRLLAVANERHAGSPYLRGCLQRVSTLRDPSPKRRERLLEVLQVQVASTGAADVALLSLAHQIGLRDETFALIEDAPFSHMRTLDGPPPSEMFSAGIIFDRSTSLALLEDPRLLRLCAKLGLCDYWIQTGQWPDCARFAPYNFEAEARRSIAAV
jgi:adenylate cyclase